MQVYTLEKPISIWTALNLLTGRLKESKNYGRQAAVLFASLGEYKYQARSLITIGLISTENHEFDSANFYFDSAIKKLNRYPNSRLKGLACFDKAFNRE